MSWLTDEDGKDRDARETDHFRYYDEIQRYDSALWNVVIYSIVYSLLTMFLNLEVGLR